MDENTLREARSLRTKGLTYRQIVIELEGRISLDQCKRNLKGSKGGGKERIDPECIREVILLGERPQGVMLYEANGVIKKYYADANDYKLRYIRDKAKGQSKNCIIHSGWIDYMKPNESHKAINAFALHLMDQVDSMVDDYMFSYPNANKWSVRYEMLKLAFDKAISPEGLKSRVNTNEVLAERMETRYE